jgi:hypothetical protein
MERLLNLITADEAKSLLSGGPLDLSKKDDAQLSVIALIALHCILNGPVGVNKQTTFPKVGAGSIKTFVDPAVTNSSWRATCMPIAQFLRSKPQFAEVIGLAQTPRIFGDLWPLSDKKK